MSFSTSYRTRFAAIAKSTSIRRVSATLIDLSIIFAVLSALFPYHMFTDATFSPMLGLFNDWTANAQPAVVYSGESLARGELPLWNPYWFAGFPHLAMPNAAVLYPTTILFGLLEWSVAIKWVFLGHVFLWGVLGYVAARTLLHSRLVGLAVAIWIVAGSLIEGFVVGGLFWMLQTMAWLPLLYLCLKKLMDHGGAHWALFAAAVFVLAYLGGEPQSVTYALYWLGIYVALHVLYRLVGAREPWRDVLAKAGLSLAAIVLGILLVSAQLIPAQEWISQSIRNDGVSFSYFRFIERSLWSFWDTTFFQHDGWLSTAGKVTLALAVLPLFGKGSHEAYILWATVLACLTYATMPVWFYEGLIKHVSVLSSAIGTTRILHLVVMISYFLCAYGLRRLVGPCDDKLARRRAWIQFSALVVLLTLLPYTKDFEFVLRTWIVAGVALCAAGWAYYLPRYPAVATAILVAVLSFEAWNYRGGPYEAGEKSDFDIAEEYLDFSENRTRLDRVALIYPWARKGFHGSSVGLLTGDRVLHGGHNVWLRRYADLLQNVGGLDLTERDEEGKLSAIHLKDDWLTSDAFRVLDLLNVREIVRFGRRSEVLDNEIRPARNRFTRTKGTGRVWIYTNLKALPVVNVVHKLIVCETDEVAWELLSSRGFDYRSSATITGEFDTSLIKPATAWEPVTLLEFEGNRMELSANMSAPGILVFSEMYYPGWKARIDDGELKDVLCINTAFRGVLVDRGRHTVELVYRPKSLIIGLLLSSLGALIWLSWAAILWRRRPKRARTICSTGISP